MRPQETAPSAASAQATHDSPSIEAYLAARGRALTGLALRLTLDRHDAADLVQDAVLRLLRNWDKALDAADTDAYVRRVLINEFMTKRRRRSATELVGLPAGSERSVEQGVRSLEDTVTDREHLRALLLTLAPRERAVLTLRFHDDLPFSEIAELLGVRVGTARSIVSRALARLQGRNTEEGTRDQ